MRINISVSAIIPPPYDSHGIVSARILDRVLLPTAISAVKFDDYPKELEEEARLEELEEKLKACIAKHFDGIERKHFRQNLMARGLLSIW